jgi:hypothetical protein
MASKTRARRTPAAATRDDAAIDALYGLEPVFEPRHSAHPEDWFDADCPYCGETVGVAVDLSAGTRSYIEDCTVCCRPYVVQVNCDDAGHLLGGRLDRSD